MLTRNKDAVDEAKKNLDEEILQYPWPLSDFTK